jgi:hypothetical protein
VRLMGGIPRLVLPNLPNTTNFSIALWFKGTKEGALLGNYNGTVLQIEARNGEISANVYADFSYRTLQAVGSFLNGQWHHLVLLKEGTTSRFYVDGTLRQTLPLPGNVPDMGGFLLGRAYTTEGWDDLLDEIRLYDRALTAAEITQLAGGPGYFPPTISLLTVTSGSSYSVANVSWQESGSGSTGYTLQRRTASTPFATVATYPATTATATDTGLQPSTTYTYRLQAELANGSSSPWSQTVAFTTLPASLTSFSFYTSQVPNGQGTDGDYELGTKFTSTQAGTITAIRYYRMGAETGTPSGKLWSSTGTNLATVPFGAVSTGAGWKQVNLPTPLPIAANTTYVVSVNCNTAYAFQSGGLATALSNGPLATIVGNNGVFSETINQFPASSFNNSGYFVDVVFVPNP